LRKGLGVRDAGEVKEELVRNSSGKNQGMGKVLKWRRGILLEGGLEVPKRESCPKVISQDFISGF